MELKPIRDFLAEHLRGKDLMIDQALATFLAGGHLLLEGPPGTGKTSLAKAMASAIGGTFRRIQMTSDLLPSDVVGILRLKPGAQEFEFREGPIFAHVVLADELNRTSPKTQSALLEAMEEATVTVDGHSYQMLQPFFVVATQNPNDFQGVYPLAESQLDRFMLQINLDPPGREAELRVYEKFAGRDQTVSRSLTRPNSLLTLDQALLVREQAAQIHVENTLLQYVTDLVRATRERPELAYGVSVRGGLQFLSVVKAFAMIRGRDYATPTDVQELAVPALAHRLCFAGGEPDLRQRQAVIREILETLPAPR